jgi:hypothetical protein
MMQRYARCIIGMVVMTQQRDLFLRVPRRGNA